MQQKKKKKKGNFGGFLGDDDIIEGKKCHAMAFPKKAKTFYYTFFLQESIGEVIFGLSDNYFQIVEYLFDPLYRYIQLVSGSGK